MTTTRSRSIIDALNIRLPLLNIRSDEAAVIGDETVYLALDIAGLSVDGTAASIALGLLTDITHEDTRAVVIGLEVSVDLVSLVNGVNSLLNVPETRNGKHVDVLGISDGNLLLNGDVVANTTVLSLEADALGVVRSLGKGVEGGSTLRVSVVVVVLCNVSV